ncbi:MAG TPA: DNA polymerase I [Verrucomicrobiales bacterium]|nr:DNA polymerase I [Verrucomicrobiales bacterium]
MAAQKLYLLDGMALIYRAYFALIRNPVRTSSGFNSSAIFVFANTLLDILERHKPTHIAVAFDTEAPTPRHREFPPYKAQREAMPEELAASIPHVKRFAQALRIPVIEQDGYEADDLIGTLARRAEGAGGYQTFMVTPDKDFAQLVGPAICIYKPGRQGGEEEILGPAEVCAKWEINRPGQVIDILGLWGDASDNIPGIPGIGEKTARKLVRQYDNLEGVLAHAGELKGKQKENVLAYADQARLSKRLATIIIDVPLDIDLDALELQEPDREQLRSFLTEFEFNALGRRFFGDDFKAGRGAGVKTDHQGSLFAELRCLRNTPHSYRRIAGDDSAARFQLVQLLLGVDRFAFDTETTSLDAKTGRLLGFSVCWKEGEACYVELPEDPKACAAVLGEFASVWEDPGKLMIGHNLKFDLGVLLWSGIRVHNRCFDTMLAHCLVEPGQRHRLDYLAESLLGYTPIPISSLIGERGKEQRAMEEIAREDPEQLAEYAAEDADVAWRVAVKIEPRLSGSSQERVLWDIELPLLPVLADMEHEGIAVDTAALAEVGRALSARAETLRRRVLDLAGVEFNLDSPRQLGEILFERLALAEKPKKTKTGQFATNEQILTSLASRHTIVQDILDYREATKLKNTYVDTLPAQVSPRSGRIHTTFQQLMTATGRLASHDPNLQNIPIRTEAGREIRRAFVPRGPGWLLLSADYSQIELRVMASLSGDEALCQAFEHNLDIHASTAAAVYGVGLDGVLPEMRRTAKMVNFGIIYGISAFGLSQRLGIPRGEAAAIIDSYFRRFPGVKRYMENTVKRARECGYVETVAGRRRSLPDINSKNGNLRSAAERTAINTPIQGAAADMIKLAMIRIANSFEAERFRSRMILQVHDELVFDVLQEERQAVAEVVEDRMRTALPLKTSIVVETGFGKNWLEAH